MPVFQPCIMDIIVVLDSFGQFMAVLDSFGQ